MSDKLLFPRPANRDLAVHTFLHALQEDGGLFDRFMEDPEAVLAAYDLDDEAKRLLATHDYTGLVARGIHPILVVQLQRRVEWGVSRYADERDRED
jgi:hypothetical protein